MKTKMIADARIISEDRLNEAARKAVELAVAGFAIGVFVGFAIASLLLRQLLGA